MDDEDIRFFSGDRLGVHRGHVNWESLECLDWRPNLRCVVEDMLVPAYIEQNMECHRRYLNMYKQCIFGYRSSQVPSASAQRAREIPVVYERE